MIRSFRDKRSAAIFAGTVPKLFPPEIADAAARKLDALDQATALNELRSPPGNRLEALKGDRAGQHSIRVNAKWRICFVWTGTDAEQVEIVDYH